MLKRYSDGEWVEVGIGGDTLDKTLAEAYSQIKNTKDAIMQEVGATYIKSDGLNTITEQVKTLMEQTSEMFSWRVESETKADSIKNATEATAEQLALIQTYMQFSEDGLKIGKSGSP